MASKTRRTKKSVSKKRVNRRISKRRVNRYSMTKRIVNIPSPRVLTRNKLITTISKPNNQNETKPNLLQRRLNRYFYKWEKLRCIGRRKKADEQRRRNFFRAKGKGNASKRPEHKQRHKLC